MIHYSIIICSVSSKTAGKRATFSFSGAFVFVCFWSLLLPVQYKLHPIKKIKISAGRSRRAIVLLRLRLLFLTDKLAPNNSLFSWKDKL